jgi:hypothetical protein
MQPPAAIIDILRLEQVRNRLTGGERTSESLEFSGTQVRNGLYGGAKGIRTRGPSLAAKDLKAA